MPSINDTVNNPAFWDEKYNNNRDGWDLKSPNPVFLHHIREQKYLKPGKILILGSGKGYDALAAAQAGFSVTSVDFSEPANKFAENLYSVNNVNVNILNKDIFSLYMEYENFFDIVYDYTTFCAVDPARRLEFIEKISLLLKPEGILFAHLFPVEEKKDGPPYGINLKEYYNITSKFLSLILSTTDIPSIKPRAGREVLQIYIRMYNAV